MKYLLLILVLIVGCDIPVKESENMKYRVGDKVLILGEAKGVIITVYNHEGYYRVTYLDNLGQKQAEYFRDYELSNIEEVSK